MALLDEMGAPTALQVVQGQNSPWWHPGRSARLQLGPKTIIAEFGELHPRVLKDLDAEGPMLAFELDLGAIPEPKKKPTKTKAALTLSPLMPLTRDFAFLVDEATPAGEVARPIMAADKALIAGRPRVRRLPGQGRAGGAEVGGRRGRGAAHRKDPDRRRDRGPVGADRGGGGEGRRG